LPTTPTNGSLYLTLSTTPTNGTIDLALPTAPTNRAIRLTSASTLTCGSFATAAPLGPLFGDSCTQTLALLLIEDPILIGIKTFSNFGWHLDRSLFLLGVGRGGEQGHRQKADS
jgi:hypothetical protein